MTKKKSSNVFPERKSWQILREIKLLWENRKEKTTGSRPGELVCKYLEPKKKKVGEGIEITTRSAEVNRR